MERKDVSNSDKEIRKLPKEDPEDILDICRILNHLTFEEIDKMECFAFKSRNCYICNGYYGPSFGEPTCKSCHAFLYPNAGPDLHQLLAIVKCSDDSDSGNDEPVTAKHTFRMNALYCFSNVPMPKFKEDDLVPIVSNPSKIEKEKKQTVEASTSDYKSQIDIEALPPEVLMNVFEYLDELSLWSVGQVNDRWKSIVKKLVRSEQWKEYIFARWPLLYITHRTQDFYNMYSDLILSINCIKCIKQMIAQVNLDIEDSSWRKHRLRTELRAMRLDPLEGIYALPLDALCCHWQASIQGPTGSPYEGGLFFLYVQIPQTYPMCPPVVRFLTKILHPNISRHGDIGIDCLHHNWSLALTISKVLISIQSLLTDPFCQVCMEPAIGELYLDNRPFFEEQARLWTWKYAMHGLRRH